MTENTILNELQSWKADKMQSLVAGDMSVFRDVQLLFPHRHSLRMVVLLLPVSRRLSVELCRCDIRRYQPDKTEASD